MIYDSLFYLKREYLIRIESNYVVCYTEMKELFILTALGSRIDL